jgi:ethanolamine permease
MSMISLFILRKKEPGLERPFRAVCYPLFPMIALLLSVISLVAMIYYNGMLAAIFFAGMAGMAILYAVVGKLRPSVRLEN